MNVEVEIGGSSIPIGLDQRAHTFTTAHHSRPYSWTPMSDGRFLLRVDRKLYLIDGVTSRNERIEFSINGQSVDARVFDEQALLLKKMGIRSASETSVGKLHSPMPGKIISIAAQIGDTVTHGQAVIVLEAMKMENELKAPVSGIVRSITAEIGASVEKNTLLIEIEPLG